MRRAAAPVALFGAAVLGGCGSSQPQPQATSIPTTLVSTTRPERGGFPRTIESFGTAAPSANGLVTLSVPQPGQVTSVPVVAGVTVRAGQPVITFAVAPSARSSYQQAVDALKASREQRRTTAQLLGQQLATRDQLVQADKAVADAQVALAALNAEGAGAGTTTLRAPVAGVVNTVPVAPGDRTPPGQALATIARAGEVLVTVGVDPALREQLRVGAPVELRRLDGGGPPISGRVARVDAALNPRTHQIDVDIRYPAGAILAGEAMRVLIRTGEADGWVVPHRAVAIDADGKARLFQIVGGKAKAVPVTLLLSQADRDVVTGPVDANAALIVDGAYQVADGDAVRVGPAR